MTWTYDGNPQANTKDEVRYLVGDTDTTDQQVSDEEITYQLAENPNVYRAAAEVCLALSLKYARQVQTTVGTYSASFQQRSEAYKALYADLRRKAARRAASVYVGGISQADKSTVEQDADRVVPYFGRDNSGFLNSPQALPDDNDPRF